MEPVALRDALGREHRFDRAPARIVSLVPSLTETLFALGAGAHVVGVTDYCVHPERSVAALPKVGGTKNPRVADVLALAPELVLANKEENRKRTIDELEAAGVRVFVTYARGVDDAVAEIAAFGRITDRHRQALDLVSSIEAARVRARLAAPEPAPRVAALIWKEPYMAVGADTFAHALLEECGAKNAFAGHGGRYPRIDVAELERAQPDVILLPTEPYAFGEEDRQELLRLDCPASRDGRVHVLEGELLTWYGPRIARALDTLVPLLAA